MVDSEVAILREIIKSKDIEIEELKNKLKNYKYSSFNDFYNIFDREYDIHLRHRLQGVWDAARLTKAREGE